MEQAAQHVTPADRAAPAGPVRGDRGALVEALVRARPVVVAQVIPIPPDHAAFARGTGRDAMAELIQSQPQRRRTRGGSASSSSRKAWTSAALSSRVA